MHEALIAGRTFLYILYMTKVVGVSIVGRGPTLDAHVGLGTPLQCQVLFHCKKFAAQSDCRVQVVKAWFIIE